MVIDRESIGMHIRMLYSILVTSLLLPIIGMIAIIVALQATMLAKRK